jgi:hypothetical protein
MSNLHLAALVFPFRFVRRRMLLDMNDSVIAHGHSMGLRFCFKDRSTAASRVSMSSMS